VRRTIGVVVVLLLASPHGALGAEAQIQVELLAAVEHKRSIGQIAYSPDGKIIATGTTVSSSLPQRTTLRLLDAASFKDLVPARKYWGDVRVLRFSSDSRQLVTYVGKAHVLEARTGRVVWRLEAGVPVCFVDEDTKILTFSYKRSLMTLDAQTGKTLQTIPGTQGIEDCAASPDGKWIALFVATRQILLVDSDTWEVKRLRQQPWRPMLMFWSRDSQRLFVRGDPPGQHCLVHDVKTGRILELAPTYARGGAFSHDGAVLALCLSTVGRTMPDCELYDASTGKLLRRLRLHDGKANVVAFSPTGPFMATGGFDKTVKIWRVTPAVKP